MKILESVAIAFSMYSKIPMPQFEWKKENMRYAMCFFPLVGAVIGLCMFLAGKIMFAVSVSPLFRGIAFTLLPLVITGGIHMDGFMDTVDALSSYGDKEKKLEIMKDPNTGAFATIAMAMYLLWSVAVWSEIPVQMLGVCATVFLVSRSLSGYAVVSLHAAKKSGLLHTFQDSAQKRVVAVTMCGYLIALAILLCIFNLRGAFAIFVGSGVTFSYFRLMIMKEFGGITGDLAGFFLQVAELAMLTCVLLAGGFLWS
ncbi:MAG: adenosylcobinamide-GDP ribazoletransferase [Lachnospiraceae bacterium]|nr:adenosylcobinamide-GDP ribazoletransferase [Lachnospiraceae bacterium]